MAYTEEKPEKIRVSLGTTIVLGLLKGKVDAPPTTAYLMTYRKEKCTANCSFCPQARESRGRADMLSRVSWPIFPTQSVMNGIGEAVESRKIKRVCLQALNYPEVFSHLSTIAKAIREKVNVQISVSCQPLNIENIRCLAKAGVERIGIPLDAATKELFDKVKGEAIGGPYRWENQLGLLKDAMGILGMGKVTTHLIVGLGETEKEMTEILQQCVDMGVLPALFAFTPISGTAFENKPQPTIQQYRKIQMVRYLIVNKIVRCEDIRFDEEGRIADFVVEKQILRRITQTGEPFLTSGCPNCNRPYYNEKPSGPMYNYPRKPTEKELLTIQKQLDL